MYRLFARNVCFQYNVVHLYHCGVGVYLGGRFGVGV